MGLIDTLLGHAGEKPVDKLAEEFAPLLAPGETLQRAFGLVRDLIVFTDRRMILVDKQGVTGVRLASTVDDSKRELEASGFFLAIGHTPNTKFLKGKLETNEKGYLVWTKPFRTNTSVEGIFAAGDVSDDYYRQAVTAAGSGCKAAIDAERWLEAQEE